MHLSMDHHLQQWRCQQQQQQSDQPSAKVAKLAAAQKPSEQESQLSSAALSLFVSEPNLKHINNTNMSAFPIPETFCGSFKMGAFSFSQWQELKQQALIYKYMIAGVPVPLDLVLPIKNSLLNSYHHQHNPHFHHHYHHHPTILQSGYWGRPLVDAEPGRCRRTDGKKWRCSRDVVSGQKYCERHVHRGKNRSRKPVETSTTIPSSTSNDSSIKNISPPSSKLINPLCSSSLTTESCFTFSGSSPSTDLFQLNCRSPEGKMGSGSHVQCNLEKFPGEDSAGTGKILRHFFDEWPTSPSNSNTHLSISISANPTSDFSLKLSTGDVTNSSNGGGGNRRQPVPAANWTVWESHNPEGSIGGPLAEALRSSGSTSSPKSVLHKPNYSISETSSVST